VLEALRSTIAKTFAAIMLRQMKKQGQLKFEMPAQGWSQFLTARKAMLDSYDKARINSRKHIVETEHGNVAEAEFRNWLKNFLPKKYAVTSGYIISAGVSDTEKTPHFDVIIYEHLDSPVLWIEDSHDKSEQGRSVAIPAEYVKAVIEVKSAFKNKTVKDAINHLSELQMLMSGIESPDERYKMYLPADFFCGIAFFELRIQDEFDKAALNSMVNGLQLRGFIGAIILRGEGNEKQLTGKIDILHSETAMTSTIEKPETSLLSGLGLADTVREMDKLHYGAMLMWSEPSFSRYAFDLVAILNGTFEIGRASSFHALGTTEWAEAKNKELRDKKKE